MKLSVFAVVLVIASVCALPQQDVETGDQRFVVTNPIRRAIEKLRRDIREAGLDPLQFEGFFEYKLLPFFVFEAFIDEFEFNGASNIAMNSLSHNPFLRRVSFDISLPELRLNVHDSGFDVTLFGINLSSRFNGRILIKQIRLTGHVSYRILINASITDISLNFSLGGIESDVRLIAFGNDCTEHLNRFLAVTIQENVIKYQNEINKYLEEIVMELLKGQ
ncbi:unnamed protein product [Euphydryas editha]|uniref:Uncharacterized protein n=1 Tax=Euphydryas editha TaxID=104508 RepID=A0AAU9UJY4_EUPED|nr:unnamed protein product [Euphydryas editha]